MGDGSAIEWTEATWNPVRGCSRVSEGCRHCYAEGVARRFAGPGQPYEGLVRLDAQGRPKAQWNGVVRLVPEHLGDPLRWKKPRRIFVNSMSDLFHEALDFEVIAAVFGVMAATPQHTYQVLTKRPARAREFFAWIADEAEDLRAAVGAEPPSGSAIPTACAMFVGRHLEPPVMFSEDALGAPGWRSVTRVPWPLLNVDVGVSVEDQETADARIPILLSLREHVGGALWVSYEPAIGAVDFEPWFEVVHPVDGYPDGSSLKGSARLNWIVVGGESGPGARPFDLAWARSVIAQGRSAGVPVFVKQLGARPVRNGERIDLAGARRGTVGIISDRKGGDPSEWSSDLRVREYPEVRRG